jgi:tRNA (mo5U34)-methyltransferase
MNNTWHAFLDEKKQNFPIFANALAQQEALLQELHFSLDHLTEALQRLKHGLQPAWEKTLIALLYLIENKEIKRSIEQSINLLPKLSASEQAAMLALLQSLKPWRKGPFDFFGVFIDSEWRSDYKWQRLNKNFSFEKQNVLDVGCGNGYFLWQLAEAGAEKVVGIDPSLHYFYQFLISYLPYPNKKIAFLPIALEALPAKAVFDSVLSMGVLYHRRAPLEHLALLGQFLAADGCLVIETLIVEGSEALFPADNYAGMPNVWCIPSLETLTIWLKHLGFLDFTVHDISQTTSDEQRQTAWIDSFSLAHFLHPENLEKTIEGHPAPLRALISARRKK